MTNHAPTPRRVRLRSLIAATVAGALIAGSFIAVGVGAQSALAEQLRPLVSAEPAGTLVLGEDATVDVTVSNPQGADSIYNLSVTVLVPDTVVLAGAERLGEPTSSYEAGTPLAGRIPAGENCAALGLDGGSAATACSVPAGMRLLVFENVSDLPAGARFDSVLRLRPRVDSAPEGQPADGFRVGDTVPVRIGAYTSSDERYVPVFPGATGKGGAVAEAATSPRGAADIAPPVRALRVSKSEPSDEGKLLRGVHEQSTVYTITVHHTGEGDLGSATVVDYLPAGLEFLGCGAVDHTTNANGNRGGGAASTEYDGAGRLDATPAVDGCLPAQTVEAIEMTREIADAFPDRGLEAGKVYTRVTWDLGTWEAASGGGSPQVFPGTAGETATTRISYRAGIPLFENTLDFGDGAQPGTDGAQTANLDNNRGASTRHGADAASGDAADPSARAARALTNVAVATGVWKGEESSDAGAETVQAVDVRMVKRVRIGDFPDVSGGWGSTASFEKGDIADYRLRLQTSEYVGAELDGDAASGDVVTDDLANGMCPVFPSAAVAGDGDPEFALIGADGTSTVVDRDAYNAKLRELGLGVCTWGDRFTADARFAGAQLLALSFDTTSGHFVQRFSLAPSGALADPNATHDVIYSARQNASYLDTDGQDGATSSGDTVRNDATVRATTTARTGVNGLLAAGGASAGDRFRVSDTSAARVEARLSAMEKTVLRHDAGVADAAQLLALDHPEQGAPADIWTKDEATPFAVGDEVWFKIHWRPAVGADVRNPALSDFLPEGVEFDRDLLDAGNQWQDSPNFRAVLSSDGNAPVDARLPIEMGSCDITSPQQAYAELVGPIELGDGDRKLSWKLGSDACFPNDAPSASPDRFWPTGVTLDLYVRVTVTDAEAFGVSDLSQNLAKYQQNNVDGEIFFQRDQAGIALDTGARLVKGIADNDYAGSPAATRNAGVNTNADGDTAVQRNRVAFRLDVTAPATTTDGYEIWDALPEGVHAADLAGYGEDAGDPAAVSATARLWGEGSGDAPVGLSARAYDWAELPASVKDDVDPAYAGRSIVVFAVNGAVPGTTRATADAPAKERGVTLGYTLVVPDGSAGPAALLQQRYENTASIVQFDYRNVSGGTTTVVPSREPGQGRVETGAAWGGGSPADTTIPVSARQADPASGELAIPADLASDPSGFQLPNASVEKTLVATELGTDTDPLNLPGVIVQGEYATFDYSVTVPAHATVRDGLLFDAGRFVGQGTGGSAMTPGSAKYQVRSATLVDGDGAPIDVPAGFTLDEQGKLSFPGYYSSGEQPRTFTVRLVVWTPDIDASHPAQSPLPNADRPQIANGETLRNTAHFDSKNTAGGQNDRVSDSAEVQYREPDLRVTKSASPASNVRAGESITFTLSVTNTGRVASYDNVVVDTVPAGLKVDPAQAALAGASFDDAQALRDGLGGTITWRAEQFPQLARVPNTAGLSYTAVIDPTTGAGRSYTNTVRVTGATLPGTLPGADARRGDRTHTASATVTAITAAIAKGVRIAGSSAAFGRSASAPIGQTMEYQVDVTLRANVHYYAPRITDQLPAGAVLDEASILGPEVVGDGEPLGGSWTHSRSGSTHSWNYDGDIGSAQSERVLRLSYRVDLTNAVPFSTNALPNTARFSWDRVKGDDSTRTTLQQAATVNVQNPQLRIVKQLDGQDAVKRAPDAALPYTLTVTNTGSTPAHHVTVTDAVPAGVVVDPASISHGGTISGAGANGGGTISWTLEGPLDPQSGTGGNKQIVLAYAAEFAAPGALQASADGLGSALVNTASVTGFESFPRDPEEPGTAVGRSYTPGQGGQPAVRDTAEARALFPSVSLDKRASDVTLAHVGESFGWTLTLVNGGQGAAQTVDVNDVLPKHWSYDPGSAPISVGGAPAVPLAEPVTGAGEGGEAGRTILSWHLGADAPASPIIPGSASGATATQRTVVITFTATPQAEATSDAGAGLTVPHTNALRAVVTDTAGATGNASAAAYAGAPDTADAFLGSADLAVTKTGAADPILAGTSDAPAWSIVVENRGPDTAEGPITVRDTTGELPAGVTVSGVSGAGWNCEAPARDAGSGATGFSCTRSDATESLAAGAEFPPIEVRVSVDAAQAPVSAADALSNTAEVRAGRTHDPDPGNNTDSAGITVAASADLALEKTVTTAAPNAGARITWQLSPRNLGPSVSVSTSERPITITDTVPRGVSGVTFADASGSWSATPPAAGSWSAGDTITWTYTGSAMPLGAAPAITLTGTIDAGWTEGAISNTALLSPGATPDPDFAGDPAAPGYERQNNRSVVSVTPGDATDIAVSKTRVVWDQAAGAWLPTTAAVEWGAPVSYLVTVVNAGPAMAREVTVVEEAPDGLSYREHRSVAGEWGHTGGGKNAAGTTKEGWDTFTLDGAQAAGEEHARSFVVSYNTDPGMPAGTVIDNWVEESAANALGKPRALSTTGSSRVADLGVVKSHEGLAVAGSTLDFTIVATNNGPSVSDGPIEIADELPAGFGYVPGSARVRVAGAEPLAIEPAVDGRRLSWTPVAEGGTLASGATIEISLTASIDAQLGAQRGVVNRATVDAPGDPNPGNDFWDDPVDVETRAAMTIVKEVAPGPWIAGTDVAYTLTVTNEGPSAVAASVTDALPAGLTLRSVSGEGWECAPVTEGATVANCDYAANDGLHAVGAGASTTITVVARIASNAPETAEGESPLTNVAELGWVDGEGPKRVDDTAEIRVTSDADLALAKTVVDPSDDVSEVTGAVAGERARYRLEVRNLGPSDALAPITVTDTLPAGLSFAGLAGGASGAWSARAEAEDPAAPADPGARQRIVFTLLPDGTGLAAGQDAPPILFDVQLDPALQPTSGAEASALVNSATVSSGTRDSREENNTDTAELQVTREADLAVVKNHAPERVRIGDELPFGIVVSNNGPSAASGVTVTDRVPAGLEVLSAVGDSAEGWTIVSLAPEADGGTTVVAQRADAEEQLAPGAATPPLTVLTRVLESAYPAVTNVATVDGAEPDRDPANNRAEDPVAVPPLVTLLTEKTAVGPFAVGEVGEYRIVVENAGPTADPGPITVTDALPAGLSFHDSPDAGVTVDGEVVSWLLPEGLAVGERAELTLRVSVGAAAYPSVTNVVQVSSGAELTPESRTSDDAVVRVAAAEPVPPLAVTGADLAALAVLGALLLCLAAALLLAARRRRPDAA
ncbi:DUF11 domain-containing protein [Leucobacter massiliensis]|uniref:DUF11 domain-containing protein n=1 Tax=Leucobacter massiliensis TaxID=1686285 RepID=A0A2S9QS89_9MICO|nr:DUF11 domain-containing protein [Leucobacter massiliensis]PRI12455.1 hypothetical protein B4915_01965 [Leucobacter massiliensis]